jgi:hypothetical protein
MTTAAARDISNHRLTMTNPPTASTFALRRLGAVATMFLALLVWAVPAAAQLGRIGNSPTLHATTIRGTDDAYDPVHDIYLVVGGYGPVWGVFVNPFGDPIAAPFLINNPSGGFAHFPRVVYSPHVSNGAGGAGGFLVSWHENIGIPNYVHTRVVSWPNRLVTPVRNIASSSTWWESGASMAYSASSQMFLAAWRSGDYIIWAARIGLDGSQIGPLIQVSAGGGSRDPSVAWNPHTNEFGVIYTGWNASGATATFARVNAAGAVVSRTLLGIAAGTYITDLAFNTALNRFVAVWHAQGIGTVGAELDAVGNVIGTGLVSNVVGTVDGLGLSYNPVSGTFLLVGQSSRGADIWGSELNARGARTSAEVVLTTTGGDAYYPRAGARLNAPQWDIAFAGPGYKSLRDQVVSTVSGAGGPGGSLGGAPPTSGGGSTAGCPGSPPFPGAVCVNGGWVPGTGDTGGGSTGGCPGSAPFPGAVCVNGGWVPGTGGTGGGGSTGGCPGAPPFPGAVCVNGGWVPGTGGTGGGGSTGGCPGTAPFPGAVCVGGGWVPGTGGSGGGGSTGGCPGTAPFPGAVCVGGGWVPGAGGAGGGGSTGGCPGTAPFPGAVCVGGGWVPGTGAGGSTGGCPGTAPFPGAVCVNGGWVPGTGGSSGVAVSASGCPGTQPFAGAVCVNGGWVPGSGGGCTTPDPFVAIGGGMCVNGGWSPRQ